MVFPVTVIAKFVNPAPKVVIQHPHAPIEAKIIKP